MEPDDQRISDSPAPDPDYDLTSLPAAAGNDAVFRAIFAKTIALEDDDEEFQRPNQFNIIVDPEREARQREDLYQMVGGAFVFRRGRLVVPPPPRDEDVSELVPRPEGSTSPLDDTDPFAEP